MRLLLGGFSMIGEEQEMDWHNPSSLVSSLPKPKVSFGDPFSPVSKRRKSVLRWVFEWLENHATDAGGQWRR